MYISSRAALVRNLSVSLVNGIITLIILLIAPLGIIAVIINTFLITITTYVVITVGDKVIVFLQSNEQQAELLHKQRRLPIQFSDSSKLHRRR